MSKLSKEYKKILNPGQFVILESEEEYYEATDAFNLKPYDIRIIQDDINSIYVTFLIGLHTGNPSRWAIKLFSGKYYSKIISEEGEK